MRDQEQHLRDIEKPNVSGCAAKRRCSMVDLPVPDGPDITMSGCFCVATDCFSERI